MKRILTSVIIVVAVLFMPACVNGHQNNSRHSPEAVAIKALDAIMGGDLSSFTQMLTPEDQKTINLDFIWGNYGI